MDINLKLDRGDIKNIRKKVAKREIYESYENIYEFYKTRKRDTSLLRWWLFLSKHKNRKNFLQNQVIENMCLCRGYSTLLEKIVCIGIMTMAENDKTEASGAGRTFLHREGEKIMAPGAGRVVLHLELEECRCRNMRPPAATA
ncbi:MAG: hypothetical protein IJ151_00530 [Bacteroidales bacterium]|nr:hypothetical protein [Bacteroidales bacterium]